MDEAKKNDLLVKLLCIIGSFALWIYIISSTNSEINLRVNDVPVKIVNAEAIRNQKLILLPDNQPKASILIKGPANSVYRAKNTDFALSVDLSNVTLKAGENKVPITTERLPSNTTLSGYSPEVTITVDNLIEKSVDIKKDRIKYSAKEGLYVPEPVLSDTVTVVSGPEEFVKKVAYLVVDVTKDNIDSSSKVATRVIPVDQEGNEVPNVVPQKSHIEVNFNVYNIKQVDVKVTAINSNALDPSINIKDYSPKPNKVKIAARDSVLKNITEIETLPLDLATVKLQTNTYPLKLNIPADVYLLDDKNIIMDPDIQVGVNVASLSTKDFDKAITTVGTAKGKVTITPAVTKLSISGTKEKIETINLNEIVASVNVENLEKGEYEIEIKVTAPVDYLVKATNPSKVKVKIE